MPFSRHKGEDDLMNPLTDKRKHYENIGRKVINEALHGSTIKKDMDLHKKRPMEKDKSAEMDDMLFPKNNAEAQMKRKIDDMGYKKGGHIEKGEHIERIRERERKKPDKYVEHYAEGGEVGHHFHDGHHVHHHHHYKMGGPVKKWIQEAISRPGALHRELHVKKGHNIPEGKLKKATHSSDPLLRKRAILAETLRNFHNK